jgi:hypothetical protein
MDSLAERGARFLVAVGAGDRWELLVVGRRRGLVAGHALEAAVDRVLHCYFVHEE